MARRGQTSSRKENTFLVVIGYVLTDLDHDLMILAHPHMAVPAEADAYDWFRQTQALLPRWTRTRWLALEQVSGGLKRGFVTLFGYDFRADKSVSVTSRGRKKISRLMESGQCTFNVPQGCLAK